MNGFKRYLTVEIGVEFKSTIYFFAILFFYSVYRVIGGSFEASIIIMAEMILTTYAMAYFQLYFLGNFDEAEHFGLKEGLASLLGATIYTTISYLFKWYDRDMKTTIFFFVYVWFTMICAFLVYRAKRDIDTAMLNEELEDLKRNKKN